MHAQQIAGKHLIVMTVVDKDAGMPYIIWLHAAQQSQCEWSFSCLLQLAVAVRASSLSSTEHLLIMIMIDDINYAYEGNDCRSIDRQNSMLGIMCR